MIRILSLNLLISFEVNNDASWNKIKDAYSIYFLNSKGKIIASADFGYGYTLKSKKERYSLKSTKLEELRNLLGLEIIDISKKEEDENN